MNKKCLDKKIFLSILVFLSLVIIAKLSLNSNEYNYVDNRMSYRFFMPTFKNILSGEYQEKTEDIIADQMPKYNYFKTLYLKITTYINIGTIKLLKLDKKDKYIKLKSINIYKDYLLYNTITDEHFINTANDDIDEINKIVTNTKANIFLYFIETDSNNNFETNYKVKAVDYLKKNLKIKETNISSLNISSFDNYKNYFYKTDHHWNYLGSYEGYKEIAQLMNFDTILKPEDRVCFENIQSYGSKIKRIADIKMFGETICMYNFNYPDFDIYISNEKKDNYGRTVEELKKINEISYGNIYDADYDEIVFINKESSNNKKLLVYANSYSNAINKLLASNYKETYIIDGRYYKEKTMIEYINDKQIDDVLILGNCMLFGDKKNW